MSNFEKYSVIVVGGGHAGCEAALASARLGIDTLLITMNISTIALMPCNPSIGGPGKGHLVREIGALGGEMAACIDETCVQMKWLNTSKGPAVRSRRAQADKYLYRQRMTSTLFNTSNLTIRQGHVTEVVAGENRVAGVRLETGLQFDCEKLIVTSGTYLNSRIILGRATWPGGPQNQRPAIGLSDSLQRCGVELRRLQTATPPRILKSSVDFSKLSELPGDPESGGFLWENRRRRYDRQISCFLAFTDEDSVAAVRRNLSESPLKLENITNVGPKHCPSIDRKIMRFPDQVKHQIFVEPEGWDSEELYLQGLTTAMPPIAQREIIGSVKGLENAVIVRYGYAIEYDALAPGLIRKTMENRSLKGLYTAGQINGTSGYEEAAAQGLIAGINAALAVKGCPPYWPSRTQSYLGVLVDDLSIWHKPEPYRITPGHAEFRLTLRDDSAERRLTEDGYRIGLVDETRFKIINAWKMRIENEIERLATLSLFPSGEMREKLVKSGTGDLKKRATGTEILQRPGIAYQDVKDLLAGDSGEWLKEADEIYSLETEIKYRGYFERETEKIVQTRFLESIRLPVSHVDPRLKLLSPAVTELLVSDKFDDLNQLVRKNCLSRSELAILLAVLQQDSGEVVGEPEVTNDK
ncbi:MAG: tRNA uridine-5-carboxymethylaminomethyl(34) synthesis enzyme MnmG [Candidatus Riflebacteria bacterium HGW-Riflebacteria-1]|jgi:tRNA uridine 5-carboxymethylaminomethyl modification enzyme|nr:MAG: tRNA uridine-5-carboxymethylaminomethyl(34) synthesis enzyme MnmG [Candidatus Riflebacteria bacterium HGW-Riflebacteria-1]